jgi:hypothetical protein
VLRSRRANPQLTLILAAQIGCAVLFVRQPRPMVSHVYHGIARRPGGKHVRELQTLLRKPPIFVCPARHPMANAADSIRFGTTFRGVALDIWDTSSWPCPE